MYYLKNVLKINLKGDKEWTLKNLKRNVQRWPVTLKR